MQSQSTGTSTKGIVRRSRLVGACLVIGMLAAACGGGDDASTHEPTSTDTPDATATGVADGGATTPATDSSVEPFSVGLMHDVSGPVQPFGEVLVNGAEVAVATVCADMGLEVSTVVEDLASDRQLAAGAVRQLAGNDDVVAIHGPTSSTALIVASPVASQEEIVVYAPSSAEDFEEGALSDWVFRAGQVPNRVLGTIVEQFQAVTPFERLAIFYDPENAFSVNEAEKLQALAEAGGNFEVVAVETAPPGQTDFSGVLTNIAGADPDAVWVSHLVQESAAFMIQARDRGIDAQFMGGATAQNPEIFEIAGEAGEGFILYAPFVADSTDPATQEFVAAYEEEYGDTPNAFAAYGYSTMSALCRAVTNAGSTDRAAIREALGQLSGHETPIGQITYDGGPDRVDPTLFTVQVEDGAFVPVE